MADRRLHARLEGRVQGVGFRFFAREVAESLGVMGYVRNTRDGAVEVVAEGDEGVLQAFLIRLKDGPTAAHVADAQVTWGSPTGDFGGFTVRA